MARSVTLKEFQEWLEHIEPRTWSHKLFKTGKIPSMEAKYFYTSYDTRDKKIFHIATRHLKVSHTEVFDGTILELLEHKMNEQRGAGSEDIPSGEEE